MLRGRPRSPSYGYSRILVDLSSQLIEAFSDHPLGLCGRHDPARVVTAIKDQERRLNILTLGVVLDINPLSEERWVALVSLSEHWLLEPSQVAYQSSQQIQTAMQEMHIQSPQHIPRVWWQICRGVQGRFKGSWRDLLATNEDHVQLLTDYLAISKATFPVLAGPVISARWLDLVHRVGGIKLKDWENLLVPLPAKQKKIARQFGIEFNNVHPLLFAALHTWPMACRKLPEGSCGLMDCPGR